MSHHRRSFWLHTRAWHRLSRPRATAYHDYLARVTFEWTMDAWVEAVTDLGGEG